MSWDNYGIKTWHIDHIKPISKHNLSDPEDIKNAFNYKNLQPLWASDNLSKSILFNEVCPVIGLYMLKVLLSIISQITSTEDFS